MNNTNLLVGEFEILYVLLESSNLLLELLLALEQLVACVFLLLQTLLGVLYKISHMLHG
jgi:hypothetical protein